MRTWAAECDRFGPSLTGSVGCRPLTGSASRPAPTGGYASRRLLVAGHVRVDGRALAGPTLAGVAVLHADDRRFIGCSPAVFRNRHAVENDSARLQSVRLTSLHAVPEPPRGRERRADTVLRTAAKANVCGGCTTSLLDGGPGAVGLSIHRERLGLKAPQQANPWAAAPAHEVGARLAWRRTTSCRAPVCGWKGHSHDLLVYMFCAWHDIACPVSPSRVGGRTCRSSTIRLQTRHLGGRPPAGMVLACYIVVRSNTRTGGPRGSRPRPARPRGTPRGGGRRGGDG